MPNTSEVKPLDDLEQTNKKTPTDDRFVTIVTVGGEYKGMINLNSAPVKVDRVSDYLTKGNLSFLPLYNAIVMGAHGETIFLNISEIAAVIQPDNIIPKRTELRQDAEVTIKLKDSLGQITGKVNMIGEVRPVDRVSDLLNYPGKRWLVVYEASYKGMDMLSTIINMNFISTVRVAD
jgi:hypothetical protein